MRFKEISNMALWALVVVLMFLCFHLQGEVKNLNELATESLIRDSRIVLRVAENYMRDFPGRSPSDLIRMLREIQVEIEKRSSGEEK